MVSIVQLSVSLVYNLRFVCTREITSPWLQISIQLKGEFRVQWGIVLNIRWVVLLFIGFLSLKTPCAHHCSLVVTVLDLKATNIAYVLCLRSSVKCFLN